jgi:type II secretory pathway pseudopilin PulG
MPPCPPAVRRPDVRPGADRDADHDIGRAADRGTSIVELLVAMGIFAIVLAVIGGATVVMVNDVRESQNLYAASAGAHDAFSRLDKQIRYATAINWPTRVGSDWYVEFASIDGANTPTCHQWRLSGGDLQQRQWVGVPVSAPSWVTVATSVANDPVTQPPFVFTPAVPSAPVQGLTVDLVIRQGALSAATVSLFTTFAARNTDVSTVTNTDGTSPGVSDVPVCQTGVGRP